MLDKEEVEKALDRFITTVVNQSKRSLTLKSKNKTRRLHKSIKGDYKVMDNSLSAYIEMERYGKYQDRGVKGVGGKKADGSTWNKKRVTRNAFEKPTPYAFKNLQPPSNAFRTDKINRPVSKAQSFATAVTVYRQGIETSEFFTKPFEAAFKKLPDELAEAYGLDVEDFIEFVINDK